MGYSNVLLIHCGQRDVCLKLDVPDYGEDSVQADVPGVRLGNDRVVAGGRAMPVTAEIGVRVNFKNIVPIGIQRD